jgi:amidase
MTGAGGELWRLGATELAHLVGTRQVSCREVIEAHLRRIEDVNPLVNAVVTVLADEALDAAAFVDQAVAAGTELGRLAGVPFTVKEIIDVTGTPTTQGLRALEQAYPTRDAPTVERLKAAGAIPIGRTNMPSGAIRWHCESELWGATLNPWDRSRTPGASSAGEAAAIATGMSPLGLGTDGLGSLRHPAQCCGVTALKPTLGRVPTASSTGPDETTTIGVQLTSVTGPLGRHVADVRAALSVIAGPTWRDPWSVPVPLAGPELAEPIRVAVVTDPGGSGTATQVQAGVRTAAEALVDAGYVVDEAEPPGIDSAADALMVMLSTPGSRKGYERLLRPVAPAPTRRFVAEFFELAGQPDDVAGELAFMTRHDLLRAWGHFLQTHPLVVAPVATEVPAVAGTDLEEGQVARTIQSMRMTMAVNALGLPAVAVPVGVMDGLPQVVQVIGPAYREDLCLDAAAALEQALGVITPIDPVASQRAS